MGANAPIYSGTYTPMSDAIVAAVTKSIGLTLGDRSGGSVMADPNIRAGYQNKGNALGALAAKKVYIGWGADKMASATEGNSFSVLTLASSSASVTLARKGMGRIVSDMARMLEAWGITDWMNFARDTTWSWNQTVVDVFAALFPSFSASGGATGTALTWAKIVAARNTLAIANVPPPYTLITRPKDWGNVSTDALTLGGAVQMSAETQRYIANPAPGFKGLFLDGELAVHTSQEIDASAGDHVSGMFGAGAIEWDCAMPAPSPATIPLLWTPMYGVEIARTVLKSEDTVVSSTHVGASIGLNAAGIKILALT